VGGELAGGGGTGGTGGEWRLHARGSCDFGGFITILEFHKRDRAARGGLNVLTKVNKRKVCEQIFYGLRITAYIKPLFSSVS
jgi:hypothetical protein